MFKFPKSQRLSSRRAIESLFADGQGDFVYPFRYMTAPGDAPGEVAVLVSVPKRNHKRAVARNLLKRRTREAWRLNKAPLLAAEPLDGLHIGLIYTSRKVEEYPTIEKAVRRIIAKIADSAGGCGPPTSVGPGEINI